MHPTTLLATALTALLLPVTLATPIYCEQSMGHDPCMITDNPSCTNDEGEANIPDTTIARLESYWHEVHGTGKQTLKGSGAGLKKDGGSVMGVCCSNFCLYVSNDASPSGSTSWEDKNFVNTFKKLKNKCSHKSSRGSAWMKNDIYLTLNFGPVDMVGANFPSNEYC